MRRSKSCRAQRSALSAQHPAQYPMHRRECWQKHRARRARCGLRRTRMCSRQAQAPSSRVASSSWWPGHVAVHRACANPRQSPSGHRSCARRAQVLYGEGERARAHCPEAGGRDRHLGHRQRTVQRARERHHVRAEGRRFGGAPRRGRAAGRCPRACAASGGLQQAPMQRQLGAEQGAAQTRSTREARLWRLS